MTTNSLNEGKELERLKKLKLLGRTIVDGIYFIEPQTCQYKAFQVEENNTIIIGDLDYHNSKLKFNIKYDNSQSCYFIQSTENELFLTCDNTNIYLTKKNDSSNQKWHIITDEDNKYEIISEENNNLIEGDISINGAKILCQSRTGKSNQKFYFEPTDQFTYFPIPDFYHPYINEHSVVDGLKSIGEDASQGYRKLIGDINGIKCQKFSPAYNMKMLDLLKSGKLIKPRKIIN